METTVRWYGRPTDDNDGGDDGDCHGMTCLGIMFG